jgi:hypothetical protein
MSNALHAAPVGVLLGLVGLTAARPCSESDVYPGWPLPTADAVRSTRPYPELLGCTQLDLANVELSSEQSLTLSRAITFAENGEFRNVSVLHGISSLVLDGVPLGDAGATVLSDAFGPQDGPLPLNVSLRLAAAGVGAFGASALAGALGSAHSAIQSLRLEWNHAIGDAGSSSIGKALRGNRALRVLGLERCGVGDAGVTQLAAALSVAGEDACATTVAGSAAARACATATAQPLLEELYLEGNDVGADGARALGAALRTSRLKRLGLALNPIGPEGGRHLAAALKSTQTTLEFLDLSNCQIGDGGAIAIGAALRGNTALRELRLYGNGIGRAGAAALADAVRINPVALRVLNLRLNELDATAGEDLLHAVRHAKTTPEAGPGLERLHVEHNGVLAPLGAASPPEPITSGLLAEIESALHPPPPAEA